MAAPARRSVFSLSSLAARDAARSAAVRGAGAVRRREAEGGARARGGAGRLGLVVARRVIGGGDGGCGGSAALEMRFDLEAQPKIGASIRCRMTGTLGCSETRSLCATSLLLTDLGPVRIAQQLDCLHVIDLVRVEQPPGRAGLCRAEPERADEHKHVRVERRRAAGGRVRRRRCR